MHGDLFSALESDSAVEAASEPCRKCESSSCWYSAAPCCQARLADDLERYQIERESIRLLAESLEFRRYEIAQYGRLHGQVRMERLKAEIERRWALRRWRADGGDVSDAGRL